jgi:transcriptional regulator with XRE-family HTH domain
MNINQKVAAKISELRTQKNISQLAVAESIDLSQNAYSQLESGNTRITIEKLFAIATYFKVPVTKLLDVSENVVFNTTDNSTAINNNNGTYNHNSVETISLFYERIVVGLNKTIAAQEETIKLQHESLVNFKV